MDSQTAQTLLHIGAKVALKLYMNHRRNKKIKERQEAIDKRRQEIEDMKTRKIQEIKEREEAALEAKRLCVEWTVKALTLIVDILMTIQLLPWERNLIARVYGFREAINIPYNDFVGKCIGAIVALDFKAGSDISRKYNMAPNMDADEQDFFLLSIQYHRAIFFSLAVAGTAGKNEEGMNDGRFKYITDEKGITRGGIYIDLFALMILAIKIEQDAGGDITEETKDYLQAHFQFSMYTRCFNFKNHVTTYKWIHDNAVNSPQTYLDYVVDDDIRQDYLEVKIFLHGQWRKIEEVWRYGDFSIK